MSDVINHVPRELLELLTDAAEHGTGINTPELMQARALLTAQPSGQSAGGMILVPTEVHLWPLEDGVEAQQLAADVGCDRVDCLHEGLQAMLSTISKQNKAQPQGSAAQVIELTEALGRADALLQKYEQRSLPDVRVVQASAAQSAPAGEREAVYLMRRTDEAAWYVTTFQTFEHIASGKSPQHEAVKLYTAAPAQPAAQEAPTPETVWMRLLDVMRRDNGGHFYASTRDFAEAHDAIVELVAAGFFIEWRNELDDDYWMAAAGEQSEAAARFPAESYERLSGALNRVFERADEPTEPAAQDQGEVQSRERWTVVCGHWQDTTLAIHGERTGHIASGIDEDAAHAIVNAHNQGLPPIAAASTGQEVEK